MAVYLVLTIEVYGLILYKGSTIVNLDDKVVLTRTMLIVWRHNFDPRACIRIVDHCDQMARLFVQYLPILVQQ